MKIKIDIDITKVRKRLVPIGGYIVPKKGKGAYNRKKEKIIE